MVYRRTQKRKRSKLLTLLMLPALLFIGLMGVFMYLLDYQHGAPTKKMPFKPIQLAGDSVTLIPAFSGQEEELLNR